MREMKDSGFVWLGKIPKSWATKKVKQIFFQKKEKAFIDNPTILSLARDGVKIRDISTNEGQLAADYSTYNPVSKNDLLLNPMDLYSGDNCNISRIEGVISPAYVNLRNVSQSDTPDFFNYYFKHQYWSMAFFAHGRGVSFENRWTLTNEVLRNYPVLYPSAMEQQAIADYLDGECARIDGIVTTQRQIIERLKEYKKSVITEAVTRGLNPDESMKDSGIDWIGKIPEHWKIRKMKYIFEIIGGNGFPEEIQGLESGEFPFCKCSDINSSDIYLDKAKNYVESDIVTKLKLNVIPEYSILMSKIGEALKKNHRKINRVKCIVDNNMEALSPLCADFCILFLYFLTTIIDMMWFDNAGTIPSVNNNKLRNFKVVFPPLSEQQAIADYLDRECARIDTIIEKRERMIELMTEYKKSLIYECVTGKKEIVDVVE